MSINNSQDIKHYSSEKEISSRNNMFKLLSDAPIPNDQLLSNIGLFIDSKNLSRLLFLDFLYRKVTEVQGVVMDFGTRWGQNGATFSALRSIYEPFNRHRKIVLFDTFDGFPEVTQKDGKSELMQKGQLKTAKNYDAFLEKVMSEQEAVNPLSHIKKFEVIKGEASENLSKYLNDNPETIISMAYFDFDLYKPTKECLLKIKDRLVKGSILGFDELNDPDSPGETLALIETFGLNNISLKRFKYASRVSYFIVE